MKKTLCIAMLIALSALAAFADIAKPPKTPKPEPQVKSIDTNMTIRLDSNAKEARLIIPRSQIKQLRAELDQIEDGSDNTASVGTTARTQTIVSGMFLSLAFAFGGIWFFRSGRSATKTGKALIVLAAIAAAGSAATFVYANAGPPAEARSITGKMFSNAVHIYNFGSGAIKLEVKPDSEYHPGVELIVPDPPTDKKTDE